MKNDVFKYPADFVKKCNDMYPDWEDLHDHIKINNTHAVGRLLSSAVGFALDEDMIIAMFQNKKEKKILESAKRAKAKRLLYREWDSIVDDFLND